MNNKIVDFNCQKCNKCLIGYKFLDWSLRLFSKCFCHFPCRFGEMVILGLFGNGQNRTLELISVHQTFRRDPTNGLNENQIYHIKTIF